MLFLILIRRYARISFEKRKEVGIVGKAEDFGDLGYRHILFGQKTTCLSNLDFSEKIAKTNRQVVGKNVIQFGLANGKMVAHALGSYMLSHMLRHIFDDPRGEGNRAILFVDDL